MHGENDKPCGLRVIDFSMLERGQEQDGGEPGPWLELARSGTAVLIDLQAVDALDRARLALLLRFRTLVRAAHGTVSLASLSGKIRRQAHSMQLHRLFEIFNTPDEAERCCLD